MHMCVFPFCSRPVSVSSRLHLCPAVLVASCELTVVWKHDLWQGSARDFNNDWKWKWKKLRCALIKWNLSVKLFVFEHQMCVSPSAPLPYLKQFQYLSPAHLRSISTVDCVTSIMFFFFFFSLSSFLSPAYTWLRPLPLLMLKPWKDWTY